MLTIYINLYINYKFRKIYNFLKGFLLRRVRKRIIKGKKNFK